MERLSAKVVDRPMTVLLDNCGIYRARVTSEVIRREQIHVLWNVPYRPELNGIEFVWTITKRKFRQLQRMMGTLDKTFEECVDQALAELTRE